MPHSVRDRFDEIPHSQGRVGAHRAENPGMHGWFVLLWATLATIVLIAVGIFFAMIAMNKISFGLAPTVTPMASQSAKPSTPPLDTSYGVLVLNATTATGFAATTRDALITAGFPAAAVVAGDAASQDFPSTTVYFQTPADRPAAEALAALVGATKIAQSSTYGNEIAQGQKQLTVVLGADLAKNAPAPAPSDTPSDGSEG